MSWLFRDLWLFQMARIMGRNGPAGGVGVGVGVSVGVGVVVKGSVGVAVGSG